LAAPDRQRIEEAISALRTAMASDELSVIQQRISTLTEAAQRIAEAKQQASQPRPDQEAAGTSAGDDVVDAEFEEVDEKRRRAS
ncbi:MAG: hypothetical protein QOK38_2783, partial [Acidobacteriaceae bacterium]|nr:hypothetical protein [Acidobacteriaceae bacterium]